MPSRLTLLLLGGLVLVVPRHAGAAIWTSSGPEGGPVTAIVFDPAASSTLWAGTAHNGVYKSSDAGATWVAAGTGGPRGVERLAIASDGTLYSSGGLAEPGVFRSTDGGSSWQEVLDKQATALATDPTAAGTVYAAAPELGVFKTTDAGSNWSSSAAGLGDEVLGRHLVVDPVTPSTVYLGSQAEAVFKSIDGGINWTHEDQGIENAGISSLVIDPLAPASLYAATSDGFFTTANGAQSWTPGGVPPAPVRALGADPMVSGTLWAGGFGRVFRSIDGGANWTEPSVAIPLVEFHVLAVDPTSSSTVYAGAGSGALKTVDTGANWVDVNAGLRSVLVDRLLVDPASADTVYAVSEESGIYKSVDGGASWQESNQGLPSRLIQDLALAPSQPQTLYAAPERDFGASTDGGASWTDPVTDASAFGLTGPVVGRLEVDPANPANVLAGHEGPAFLGGGPGIYRSTDGASTWAMVHDAGLSGAEAGQLATNPTLATEVIAAFSGSELGVLGRRAILLLSTDGGATWMEVHRQAGDGDIPLDWDPFDSDTAWAVVTPGDAFEVLRSTDGGVTWTPLAVSTPCANDLLPDPATADKLWLACDPVFESTDGGASWSPFDVTGFPVGVGGALTLELAGGAVPKLHAGTEIGVYSYSFILPIDLAVDAASAGSEFLPGAGITYTLTASNAGPGDGTDVSVTDTLPADVTCSSRACVPSGGATCNPTPPTGDLDELVDLPVGGAATFTATCTIDGGAGGFLEYAASITPPFGQLDPDLSDNADVEVDVVLETGPCGEPNDRILAEVDLDTPQEIEACNSITTQTGVTVNADVVFRAPEIRAQELSVDSGSLTVFDDVP